MRALGIAALFGAAGVLAWAARSRVYEGVPVVDEIQPAEDAPSLPLPAPAPPRAGRISAQEVLALRAAADPDGWMPAAELLAFVEIESGFNPNAYRFEPRLNEASYGLMQVLASTGRDMGLQGAPEAMFDPATSLQIGISYSRWSWDYLMRRLGRDPTEIEWVGSYNAGVGNVLRGFTPHSYVRKWQLARDRWQL